jgi:hypothetical protein
MIMQKNKRDHHILPRKYLKGFCQTGSSFVWVFRRGHGYQPDRGNPSRSSVRKTAYERDRNTVTNSDGTRDYNTFEDVFQRIETKADKPFAKIRSREPLTLSDKEKLARYIGLMIKRVDTRKETIEQLLDKQLMSPELDRVVRKLAVQGYFSVAYNWLKSIEYLRSREGKKYLRVRTTGEPFKIVHKAITKMQWGFVVPPEGKYFVTSDNPVIYDTHFGLKRSPLLFPLDQRTALIATWHGKRDLAYIDGSIEQVLKFNGIILAQATKEVYAHTSNQWIHQALENGVVINR